MPFCPNCHTEFAAGVEQCTECGSDLVASLPTGWSLGKNPAVMQPTLLGEFTDQVQIGLVEAQLREAGIPFVRKPRVVGLFIPTAFLARAQQILTQEGTPAGENDTGTLCLSELHRMHLVCAQCEHEVTVDLLAESVPNTCPSCGRLFDLDRGARGAGSLHRCDAIDGERGLRDRVGEADGVARSLTQRAQRRHEGTKEKLLCIFVFP